MARARITPWVFPLGSEEKDKFDALVKKHKLSAEAVDDLEQLIDEFAEEAHGHGADSVECEDD
jgi:hypothetical protein